MNNPISRCTKFIPTFHQLSRTCLNSSGCFITVAYKHTIVSDFKIGPKDMLIQKTKNRQILKDEIQLGVAGALQVVYENIKDYKPVGNGIFNKLFSSKKKAPKGLYIYGAVGKNLFIYY